MLHSNLPAGADNDPRAPGNIEEIDFDQCIENYINHILHQSTMPFDEIGYLIDLLRETKHAEKINDILINYDN